MGLDIWNKLAKPPVEALKKISGGRLAGKSDINPQWRYKVMTEVFGPCGTGWKYTIEKLWTEPGTDGEIFAFAQVSVQTITPETPKCEGDQRDLRYWSAPIPGVGGHKLIESESRGLHNNDEAFKMAVTDALSVALKMLGVAAEVYLGHFDGSKYSQQNDAPATAPQRTLLFDRVCRRLEEAAPEGMDKLAHAWGSLTAEERKLAGVSKRFDQLKQWIIEQEGANAAPAN